MNNDYCLQSYRNNDQGDGANKLYWYQKTQIYKVITNPMFIVCLIIFIGIIVVIYWNYIRPRQFKTIYKKLLQFAGFKYSHLTNQEREAPQDTREATREAEVHGNSHFIIYGSSGSGKTSFLKHYLAQVATQRQRNYVVFGRDEREFPLKILYHYCSWRKLVLNHLLIKLLYWMMQVHTKVLKQK